MEGWKHILNRASTKIALTVALLAILSALSLSADFYNSSLVDAFMAMALGGVVITLLVVQPSWVNFASVVAGGFLLAGIDYRILRFHPKPIAALSFAGLSALAVLGARAIWTENKSTGNHDSGNQSAPDRTLFFYAFFPTVLFCASEYMASALLDYTEALHPKTFDLYLYSFDCSLRVQFSFLVGQMFAQHLWFRFAGLLFYIALPLPLALVYAAHLRQRSKAAFPAMLAFLVTGPLGVLFYNLVPATGPVHIFGPNFPWHPLQTSQAMHLLLETIPVKGARNAIPSLHMAWVLLIWWNSKGLGRWIRVIALAFVVFTVLATLGTGEHYFVDLVVAFPFALMVQALCQYSLPFKYGPRRMAFLFGSFASLAWMALVSFATPLFWISPAIPWAMVTTTVVITTWLMTRFQSSEIGNEQVTRENAVGAAPWSQLGSSQI